MKLGVKQKETAVEPAATSEPEKMSYPSLDLRDDIAKEFIKTYKPTIGSEFSGKVQMRVNAMREDQYGCSVGFEMTDFEPARKSKNTASLASEYVDKEEETKESDE